MDKSKIESKKIGQLTEAKIIKIRKYRKVFVEYFPKEFKGIYIIYLYKKLTNIFNKCQYFKYCRIKNLFYVKYT